MNRAPRLSRWHDAADLPARVGVYQRRYTAPLLREVRPDVSFAYWDGTRWGIGADTPDSALRRAVLTSGVQPQHGGFKWRGLAGDAQTDGRGLAGDAQTDGRGLAGDAQTDGRGLAGDARGVMHG